MRGFYEALFGWRLVSTHDMGAMGGYDLMTTDGGEAPALGMMTKPEQVPRPFWGYYINVEAIDAAAERVKAGGGQILMGPAEVPNGQWILQAFDPQGGYFGLLAPHR